MKKPTLKFLKSLEGKFVEITTDGDVWLFHDETLERDFGSLKEKKIICLILNSNQKYNGNHDKHFNAKLINSSLKAGYISYAWWAIKEIKVIC